ncbi:hypothetical protein KP509_39G019100 [Ceratopteris richardii]|uniref:Uncharacterized protein n=1 Tax=Ceratopteris richardii TaxID=49495 RepID=A0A8T2PZD5_CERRI|nr:hypothetical protein KP509_39G019100 [Ceratopteris richardii]KAH7276724.1 hypothetical protein KP509_39G019100 [Ceratopteris richardii]
MATYLRLFCLMFSVLLIFQCVQGADVEEGRKLAAGSDEQELWYGKEGHHKGMGGWKKGGHDHMGGWKKGYHGGKGGYESGHGKGGYGKGYPGHPH